MNINAPNITAPKYTEQILTHLKGEIDGNTVIGGDFNTLSILGGISRQKTNKETVELNNTIE